MNRQMDGHEGEKGGMIGYVPSTSDVKRKRGKKSVVRRCGGREQNEKEKKPDQT